MGEAGCQENRNEEGDGTTGLVSEWVGLVAKRTGIRRARPAVRYRLQRWLLRTLVSSGWSDDHSFSQLL